MKTIFALCALILAGAGAWYWHHTHQPIVYGEFTQAPHAEVSEIIQHPEDYMHKTVSIEGEITDQCESMGCYFFFKVDGKSLRVDLAEIAMNAPRGRNGKHARVEGRMVPYDSNFQFWASAVEFQ